MSHNTKKELSSTESEQLLKTLKARFDKHNNRHKELQWDTIEAKLKANPEKLWSLHQMESTGGEPDVVAYDKPSNEYIFFDCAPESPNRRSLCYDRQAWESRKQNKPKDNAMDVATAMGIELLDEDQYRSLQSFGSFDNKTSTWLKTPSEIRQLGGAIFGDFRYNKIFIYHNGAESYYAARGFRGVLRV